MKKVLIAASALALLTTTSLTASAEEVSGAITSIDPTAMTVTLDDGNTYRLPVDVNLANLQIGEQVKIEFESGAQGELMATSVEPGA